MLLTSLLGASILLGVDELLRAVDGCLCVDDHRLRVVTARIGVAIAFCVFIVMPRHRRCPEAFAALDVTQFQLALFA